MKQTNQPTESGLLSGTIFSRTAIHDYLAPHTQVVQLKTKHLTYHKSFQVTNCVAFGNIVESHLLFFKLSWSISILKDIEDITRWREDMNFMFEWQEQYLTSERSERVKYCSYHENIKFISSSQRVMFFLLYKHTDDGGFDDFPKISDHFPKISKDFPKLFRRPDERSRTFSENFRRLSRKTRRCFDDTPMNLSTI